MGLDLNIGKCELVAPPETSVDDPRLCSFTRVGLTDASLLGAPLFHGEALDRFWTESCSELDRAVDRLKLISSQDALILLRASFSAPRVQHLLRCSPSVDHADLITFDSSLRSALCHITNTDVTDTQWLQASLPIKAGGLGVRRVASLALPAYLASAASTLCLQETILSRRQCPLDSLVESYRATWSAKYGPEPVELMSHKQSTWDWPGIVSIQVQLQESILNSHNSHQQATFLAASTPHSGDWLAALPIAACGLRLDDEAVRVAVSLRLGLSVCIPHTCPCGQQVDALGLHAWVCKHAPGRIQRHHAINDVISRAFVSAGIPVTKEPKGLFLGDVRRPDGLTLIPWQTGKAMTWDVTIASTLADSYVDASAKSAGAAAEMAASRKSAKYADLPASYLFQPIALESLGAINESAVECLLDLGGRIAATSGDEREGVFLFQRLSVILQRYNSILLHNSFVMCDDPDL